MELAACNPKLTFSQNDVVVSKKGGPYMLVENYDPKSRMVTCLCFKGGYLTRSEHNADWLFLIHYSPKLAALSLVPKKKTKKLKG